MDVSLFLAKVMGLYLCILSISMLIHAENFTSILAGIFHNASIQFVLAIYILVLGLLMVVSHNIWDGTWVMVITILSWLVLLKGILYITFPKSMSSLAQSVIKDKQWLSMSAVVNLLLGLFLTYMGFFA